jgi:hypothetical protein
MAIGGVYQFITGDHPVFELLKYGVPKINPLMSQRPVIDQRMMLGALHFRASCPFLQSIMFGWFFALMVGFSTNLFWEKRKIFPWIIPWCFLPVGIICAIAGGPMMLAALSMALPISGSLETSLYGFGHPDGGLCRRQQSQSAGNPGQCRV